VPESQPARKPLKPFDPTQNVPMLAQLAKQIDSRELARAADWIFEAWKAQLVLMPPDPSPGAPVDPHWQQRYYENAGALRLLGSLIRLPEHVARQNTEDDEP
jgi:hypothetical protein